MNVPVKAHTLPCEVVNPFREDTINRIMADIASMKDTKNFAWNLNNCLQNNTPTMLNAIFFTMKSLNEKLKSIDLQNNKLVTLPPNFGDTWPALKIMKLANNLLSELPEDYVHGLHLKLLI